MNGSKMLFGVLLVLALMVCSAQAQTNLLTNSDFEDTTGWGAVGSLDFPVGWPTTWLAANKYYKNPATPQTGFTAIGGSGTSAYLPKLTNNGGMQQDLEVATQPEWVYEVDFAVEDPGGQLSYRSLNMTVGWGPTEVSGSTGILCRVVGETVGFDRFGTVQFYAGGGVWQTAITGAVTFDADVEISHTIHHMKIEGYFAGATPYYDVELSDAVGAVLGSALNMQAWYPSGVAPAQGEGMTYVRFYTDNCAGDSLIDNVVLRNMHETVAVPGDTNGDQVVDETDAAVVASNWYATVTAGDVTAGDFNNDGVVNLQDASIQAGNWGDHTGAEGSGCVPEPSVMILLLGLPVLFLFRHRR